jgi:ABC-type lipoprotein release transport system permease subunit
VAYQHQVHGIPVAASVLPALRAARLHPVEALRHD